MKNIITG